MPAVSQAQQRFFGAELNRAEHGKKTKTGLDVSKLKEFASTKRRGLPRRVGLREGL